jgi:hypothetical protein
MMFTSRPVGEIADRRRVRFKTYISKTFRGRSLDQRSPVSPAGHLSRFVAALVTEELDLLGELRRQKGEPPHPVMAVELVLYAYAVGVYARVGSLDAPDFRIISEY